MPAFGIRAILFAAAVVLFFIGLVADVADSFDTWVPLGLIATRGHRLLSLKR